MTEPYENQPAADEEFREETPEEFAEQDDRSYTDVPTPDEDDSPVKTPAPAGPADALAVKHPD